MSRDPVLVAGCAHGRRRPDLSTPASSAPVMTRSGLSSAPALFCPYSPVRRRAASRLPSSFSPPSSGSSSCSQLELLQECFTPYAAPSAPAEEWGEWGSPDPVRGRCRPDLSPCDIRCRRPDQLSLRGLSLLLQLERALASALAPPHLRAAPVAA
jgi:hypothetical protein